MKKNLLSVFAFVLTVFCGIFLSCEVGLGDSIDTKVPKVEITSPSADYIVRDEFTISGTWSDDGELKDIDVVLTNTSTKKKYPENDSFKATIIKEGGKDGGNWTCKINPLSESKIPDGSYEVSVTAIDTAGNKSGATRGFVIDNTPPLLSLTRPSTKFSDDGSSADSYGQDFSITGSVMDSSNVDSIEVEIYSAEGDDKDQLKKTVTLKNVPPTIDLSVAKWGSEAYESIYGTDKNAGTKKYWCKISVYDSARKIPEEEGDKGNGAAYFYLNNEISSDVIQTVKLTNAYYILNGTYDVTDENREIVEKVKSALSQKQLQKAVFSLNPLNNPSYELSGYTGLDDLKNASGSNQEKGYLNDSSCELMNKTKQTVNISAGLDQIPLDKDTIGIFLQECDKNGNIIENAEKITLLAPWKGQKDSDGNRKILNELSEEQRSERESKITPVGSYAYKVIVEVNSVIHPELKAGKYYVLGVDCYDQNDNEANNAGNEYAFKLSATAAAPVVKIDGEKSFYANKEFELSGTATVSQDDLEIELFAYIDSTEDEFFASSADGRINFDKNTENFSLNVPKSVFEGKSAFTVFVQAGIKGVDGNRGTDQVQVNFDDEAPVISEISVTPILEEDNEEVVNGIITVKANITDNGIINRTEYSLILENGEESERIPVSNISSSGFTVDTTKFEDNKKLTIKIYANDTSGNEGIKTKTVKINQSSDSPKIKFSNIDDKIKTVAEIKNGQKNILGTDNNHTLIGSVEDDDGIKTIKIFYQKVDVEQVEAGKEFEWNENSATVIKTDAAGSTSFTLKFDSLPKDEGAYLVKVLAEDKLSQTSYSSGSSGPFLVAVDNGAPQLAVSNVSGAFQAANSQFTITGSIDDSSAEIRCYSDADCSGEGSLVEVSENAGSDGRFSWNFEEKTGDKGKTLWFKAEDCFGQSSKQKFSYIVDTLPPTFTIESVNGESFKDAEKDEAGFVRKYGNNKNYFTLRGTVTDPSEKTDKTDCSGLGENFFYILSENEPEKDEKDFYKNVASTWKKCAISATSAGFEWSAPIDLSSYKENVPYTVYLAAVDNAGNVSKISKNPSAKIIITLDSESPEIKTFEKFEPTKLVLKARDSGSGIKDVKFLRNGTTVEKTPEKTTETVTEADGTTKEFEVYTFILEKEDVPEGTSRFRVEVTDKAGNTKSSDDIEIKNFAPSLSLVTDADSNEQKNKFLYSNKDIIVTASVKDENQISSLVWREGEKISGNVAIEKNNEKQELKITIPAPATDCGETTRIFTATNVYGLSSEAEVKYIFDVTKPEFKAEYEIDGNQKYSLFGKSGAQVKMNARDFAEIWFNSTSLMLDGCFEEATSGIKSIRYELKNKDGTILSQGTSLNGSEKGNFKFFNITVSDFENSTENHLKLYASDKAGNEQTAEWIVKVDSKNPELKENSLSVDGIIEDADKKLSNGKNDVVIKGSVFDELSGISKVQLSLDNGKFEKDAVLSESEEINEKNFEFTVLSAELSAGNKTVYAKIFDNAGNSPEIKLFDLVIDKKSPTVTFISPKDADSEAKGIQVNKTITLKGSADDKDDFGDGRFDKVTRIFYSTDKNSAIENWNDLKLEINGDSNWSAEFNTAQLSDGKYFFKAEAVDKVGNTGYSEPLELEIDQNSDRPTIKIISLETSGQIVSNSKISGSVSDDDGIDGLYYSTDSADLEKTPEQSSGWKKLELSSDKTWSFELLDEGNYDIYFYAKDLDGGIFYTKNAGKLERPFIQFDSSEKSDNQNPVRISLDKTAPSLKNIKCAVSSGTELPIEESVWKDPYNFGINLGNNSPYLFVQFEIEENVSMNDSAFDDVKLSLGNKVLDLTGKLERTGDLSSDGKLSYTVRALDSRNFNVEGKNTITVTATDKSGRTSSKDFNATIDNAAPSVSIDENSIENITGKCAITGKGSDPSGISIFNYLIPTKEQVKTGVTKNSEGWIPLKTSTGETINDYSEPLKEPQWKIEFNSSSFEKPENLESLIYYATAKNDDGSLKYAEEISGYKNKVNVPVYFYIEDATGNAEVVKEKVPVNVRGGIPTVEVTSHEDFAKTGSTVILQGSADDDEKISSVRITKVEYLIDGEITDSTDWKPIDDLSGTGIVVKGNTSENPAQIIAEGTRNWKAGIDVSKIENKEAAIKALRFTVESYDENGTSSSLAYPDADSAKICQIRIYVDSGVPEVKDASIVGFNSQPVGVDGIPVWEKSYSAGMCFSGKKAKYWYLKTVVTDESSVIDVGLSMQSGNGYIPAMKGFDSSESEDASSNGTITFGAKTAEYTVFIPIDVTKEGNVYATLSLNDGQHSEVETNYAFKIDNTAPTLYSTDNKNLSAENPENLRLTSRGENVGLVNVIENSDGSYTFGDEIEESGSSLDFVAVYFKKPANEEFGTTERIFNPLFATTETQNNKTEVDNEKSDGKVYINSENLPALYKKVTVENSESDDGKSKITFAGLGSDFNINGKNWNPEISKFGLVKINGTYHRISEIEGDAAIIEDELSAGETEAEFIYALLIDHEVMEGFDSTSETGVSNDDGDGLVEMVKRSGSKYKWTASVYSDNIPDGPAEIHVVAFDQAGNSNYGYVKTSIQNNRPRISRVMLATDLNGNGKFDFYNEKTSILNDLSDDKTVTSGTQFGEFVFYSTLKQENGSSNKAGDALAKVTLSGRTFKIKKDLLVLPEFVGGNGELGYTYSLENSKEVVLPVNGEVTGLVRTSEELKLADKKGTEQSAESLIQTKDAQKYGGVFLKMDENDPKIVNLDDGSTKYLAFTFWDKTDETKPGIDSLWAMINIPAIIDVKDTEKPNGTIKPFWWNSKEDSSFVYDDDGQPLGHIDLPGTGETKPGVSGEVFINGTSFDDTRIGEIHIVKPDGNAGAEGDVKIIWNENDEWKVSDGAEILSEEEPSQDGHRITWRYKIDMTPYGIATDKSVKTYVVDAQANTQDISSESQQTTEENPTSVYKMDFVPYIKSIYPAVSGSANRSRLGKFPVRAGEDMVIEGMNFAKDENYTVNFYKSKTTADGKTVVGDAVTAEQKTGKISEDGQITVVAPEYSRWVEVVVGGVATRNNTNANSGCNIEEGYVAGAKNEANKNEIDNGFSKANKAGTNFWTDDRYISVWKVGTSLPGSINPHSGAIKKVDKYNSGSGAGTQSGNDWNAAPASGGGQLYKQDGYSSAVDPVYGMNDSYYAAISSDDLKLYGYVSGKEYSKGHGDNIAFNSSEVAYVAPVDEMDYTIVNGVPYYVMQDNGLGGSSGSVWGLGLCMMREGIWYDRNYFNPYGGNTIEETKLPFFVERQGNNVASHKRDSSTGYDSILYQFKNPRIAGWYNATDSLIYNSGNNGKVTGVDYIYISYYDSYAKCLKYAAYRVGHRFASNDNKYSKADLKNWGKIDIADNIDIVAEMTSSPNTAGNQPAQKTFNHMTDGAAVVAGKETTSNSPTYTEIAGEWSDIFVDSTTASDPRPVIIYYNKTKKCLEVAYGNNSFPQKTGDWTKSAIKPTGVKSDFGRYVSAAMDSKGNLHVAAQDADKAKLYYLYLEKSGITYSVKNSIAVDSSNGAGRWTDIELTNPEGTTLAEIKPVISYIDTSYLGTQSGIKVAWLESVSDGNLSFEAMTDPANYSSSDQRTSVMAYVKETKGGSVYSPVAVGFNSDMFAVDFLRGEE